MKHKSASNDLDYAGNLGLKAIPGLLSPPMRSACVEKTIYNRMILTRVVKIPLAIVAGVLLLSIIVIVYITIPHRIKDPFAVKLKHMSYDFKCTNIDDGKIQIQYFWLGGFEKHPPYLFGITTVFGFDSIPDEFLVGEDILVRRLADDREMSNYKFIKDTTPMVYLDINNNHIEQFLAVTSVRYGVQGSRFDLHWYPDSWLDYIQFDKFSFEVIELDEEVALTPVTIIRQEERAIIIDKEFNYYLITDGSWLANDPVIELRRREWRGTKSYWLVENNSFGGDG